MIALILSYNYSSYGVTDRPVAVVHPPSFSFCPTGMARPAEFDGNDETKMFWHDRKLTRRQQDAGQLIHGADVIVQQGRNRGDARLDRGA
jgi:hypothetical protein